MPGTGMCTASTVRSTPTPQRELLQQQLRCQALNVITGPATLPSGAPNPNAGKAECTSVYLGTDPKCVPYNVWTPGGITPASVAYLSSPLLVVTTTTEEVVSGSITGDLGQVRTEAADG